MAATDFATYRAEIVKIKRRSNEAQIPMELNRAPMFLEALAEEQIAEMGMVRLLVLKGRSGARSGSHGPVLLQGEPDPREAGLRARAWPAALRIGRRKLYDRLAIDRAVDALSRPAPESRRRSNKAGEAEECRWSD